MSPAALPDFLNSDEFGEVFLKGHRVTLHQMLWHYNNGYSPEALHEQFPTLSMGEIHQVLSYYWNHMAEVDEYLRQTEQEIERQRLEAIPIDFDALRLCLAQNKTTPSKAG